MKIGTFALDLALTYDELMIYLIKMGTLTNEFPNMTLEEARRLQNVIFEAYALKGGNK